MYKSVCQVCGKEFFSQKKDQKNCSYSCSNRSGSFYFTNPSYCEWCKKLYYRPSPSKVHKFCSKKCEFEYRRKDRIHVQCKICQKDMYVSFSNRKKKYCSRKCMGVDVRIRNVARTPQYRSFGECVILCLLRKNYTNLEFVSNERNVLDGYEIDIWIPELKSGIEYNGIHHFQPVYGQKTYENTIRKDKLKKELSIQRGINLYQLNVPKSISYTSKTKYKNLFIECCKHLNLPEPTIFQFTIEEIKKEKTKHDLVN